MSGKITLTFEDVGGGDVMLAGLIEEIGRDFPNLDFKQYTVIGKDPCTAKVIIVLEPDLEEEE